MIFRRQQQRLSFAQHAAISFPFCRGSNGGFVSSLSERVLICLIDEKRVVERVKQVEVAGGGRGLRAGLSTRSENI